MSAPPYQKFFWGSYHKNTAHLKGPTEHGAYLLIIGALWNNGGRLAADDASLAAHAQMTVRDWLKIKPKLMPFFTVRRGKLSQPRVTDDLAKFESTSCKRKSAGKLGAIATNGKRTVSGAAIAARLPTYARFDSGSNTTDSPPSSESQSIHELDADSQARALRLVRGVGE